MSQVPNVFDVANYFIRKGQGKYTNLDLQKLIFFAHGIHLASNNGPLIQEEFQAWKFGPVVPELYNALSRFGSSSVDREFIIDNEYQFTISQMGSMDLVHEKLGPLNSWSLVEITHRQGTPWADVYDPKIRNIPIKNEAIENYFKK